MKISHLMERALFNEDIGYYRTKNPIGKNSDFITAPEISQVFGELLAAYILSIFQIEKTKIAFVEMGAGRGTLMLDLLTTISKLASKGIVAANDFLKLATLNIIEISETLTKIQQQNLKNFPVKWYSNFDDFLLAIDSGKNNEKIFFISNELFDCFPIDQFVKTTTGWQERIVRNEVFCLANFDHQINLKVKNILSDDGIVDLDKIPVGAFFEYSEKARNFMNHLCQAIKKSGGIAINFDYGYFKNEFANTLQAVKNHQKVNLLKYLPNCDITSHVDFNSLDKIAQKFNLNSSLVSQRNFFLSLGIEERRKILSAQNPKDSQLLESSIDRIVNDDKMGNLFKCHLVWK